MRKRAFVVEASAKNHKQKIASDEDLLQSAMGYVPSAASEPKKTKGTATKKPALKKKGGEKKKVPPKAEAVPKIAKDAKMPGAESTEQNRSLHFESSHYGSCKLIYTEKSYIRFRDLESGKWKNIIGSWRK